MRILCTLVAVIGLSWQPSAGAAEGATGVQTSPVVAVPLSPIGLQDEDVVVEGDGGTIALNLPLLRRVVMAPEDLQRLELSVQCRRAEARVTPWAQGRSTDLAIDLGQEAGLRNIALQAGQELAICAWKADAHYHGAASIADLRITRTDSQATTVADTLPSVFDAEAQASGLLGRFQFVGLGDRDRFPSLHRRTVMRPGRSAGEFAVPDARGASLTCADGVLRLHSNGRGSPDAAYDWAPALVFTARETGTYAITGTLALRSAEKGQQVAWLIGRVDPIGPPLTGAALDIRAPGSAPLRVPLTVDRAGKAGPVAIDLTASGRIWLAGTAPATISVAVVDQDGKPLRALVSSLRDATATLISHPKTLLFDQPLTPQDGVYATMRAGRLHYGDQRLRLWGMVKDGPGERIRRLGFNSVRVWFQDSFYTRESAQRGVAMDTVMGDGSKLDEYDRMMADYRRNGLFIMLATTVGSGTGKIPIDLMTSDESWLAGGEDWPAWKAAVRQAKNLDGFAYVDERLWRVRLRHAENVLNHRNPYTGKRYAEEESIALIEVNNEAGLVKRWLENGFGQWPAYFRQQLLARWNAYLAKQYADQSALVQAWGAIDQDEAWGALKAEPILANRHRYPRARQQDLLRFVCGLIDERNQAYRTFCRSLAPAGVGVNAIPFSFDSQYQPNTAWTYGNALGDTSTVSMYFWRHDSMLTSPPGLYVLDSTRTADRLAVIYETQRARPSPCRTEYPYLLAAMTAWQDFDVVMWHGSWIGKRSDEELLAGTVLPPTKDHFWNGVHLEHDPVMSAAIAMAGRLFLAGTIGAAPQPATYRIGADAIFTYDHWNGLGGRAMSQDTFMRGSRLVFAADSPGGVTVDGIPLAERPAAPVATGAVSTGRSVTWDWPNGRLIIDAPTAKILVGRTPASHRFADGITLSGLEQPFTAFALISADGRPLAGGDASQRMLVSAGCDAENSDFAFDFTVPGGPLEQAKAVRRLGHAPVVVEPAGFTLAFPTTIQGAFTAYDFAMRRASRVPLDDAAALRQPGQTWWLGEITLTGRGADITPACDPSPGAVSAQAAVLPGSEHSDPALAAIPHPIPGVSWGDNYFLAHHTLRDSPLTKTAVSPLATNEAAASSISVVELDGIWGQPANVDLSFQNGHMQRLVVTFDQAPAFADLLQRLRQQHGAPASEKLVSVASEQSEVRWQLPGGVGLLATEVQGVVRLVYELGIRP